MIENKDYNPNWEAIHDYHHGERERLQKAIKAWHKGSGAAPDHKLPDELEQEFKFHHQTCQRCLDTLQHRSVEDYYDWLLKNSEAPVEESFLPPKEGFKSIEDVRKAWKILKGLKTF